MGSAASLDHQDGGETLGHLSVSLARRVWSEYDKNHDGFLDRKEALHFLQDFLKKSPTTGGTAKEWLARLDRDGDGKLSFEELTGHRLAPSKSGDLVLSFSERGDLGPYFGRLNRDVVGLVLELLPSLAPLKLVCKSFYHIVGERCRPRPPTDFLEQAARGRVVLHLTDMDTMWMEKESIYNDMMSYIQELGGRRLSKLSFKRIWIATDQMTAKDLTVKMLLNGRKISSIPMNVNMGWLPTNDTNQVQEARGEKAFDEPVLDPYWYDLLFNVHATGGPNGGPSRTDNQGRIRWAKEHREHVLTNAESIIQEAERNEAILHANSTLQMFHSVGFGSHSYQDELRSAPYTSSVLEFQVYHNRFLLGSIHISLGVVGFMMSEKAFIPELDKGPALDLVFQVGLDTSGVKKVDPEFIQARMKVIIQEFRKEVTSK
jgi:hypothetical protein